MPADRTKKQKNRSQGPAKSKEPKGKKKARTPPPSPSPPPSNLSCPVEVIQNILKYTDLTTLSRCLRVSKEFYSVAAPLLYSNIILKDQHPLTKLLVGSESVERPAKRYSSAVVNTKSTALSAVQQITVMKHSCKRSSFTSDTLPNLKTLLIVPHLNSIKERWCADRVYCPILQEARPEKVVIHNSRFKWSDWHWPMSSHQLNVKSPTLTLVVDETELGGSSEFSGLVHIPEHLNETRLIVCKTPSWLDKLAYRETISSEVVDIHDLTTNIIIPFLRRGRSAFKQIYLFRAKDSERNYINRIVNAVIDRENRDRSRYALLYGWPFYPALPDYTIKTLKDYIEEGVEDELLEEELQYWREENSKRLNEGEGEAVKEKVDQVLH